MGRKPAQPAAIVDYRTADPVHHAAQREGELPACLGFVPAPTWRLTFELRTHLGPTVIARRQLVRLEILETPVRPGLQSDDVQPGTRQHRSDQPTHTADSDEDHIGPFCRR